jgi:SAM-dependent methyltransferase
VTEATAGTSNDSAAVRRAVSRHIVGSGVELGPGHNPFPLAYPGATAAYVDRWEPAENRALFVELGDEAAFPKPDVVCNLDTDRLKMLDDQSQDFVIASHVLEHMANPIALLDDIHRVLRPGGIALVLLPDMRRTFDNRRPVTDLDHLVREYEAGVTEVDDEHIRQFLEFTEADYQAAVLDLDPAERDKLFERHRLRSIHVHCWSELDFPPVIHYAIGELGHRWEFVDGILTDDEGLDGIEFGYVLRRSTVELPADVMVERFTATFDVWAEQRRRVHAAVAAQPPVAPEPVAPEPVAPLPRRALRRARRLAGRARRALFEG